MAGFNPKSFLKHDDYTTPKSAWEAIADFIPKDKVIYEPFYGDGKSGEYLRELGFNVIHEPIDFFENDLGEIIVSNPPFSKSKEILKRLKLLGKPFIVLFPASKICTNYTRDFVKDNPDPLQIIIPRKRIHFLKLINGQPVEGWKPECNFDCFYYCWKINLPSSIVFLD
jgi:hypothetical protein